jgi:hypothetical protein
MIRDCGLSVAEGELDADWNDILNSVGEEDECTEPVGIFCNIFDQFIFFLDPHLGIGPHLLPTNYCLSNGRSGGR